MRMWSRERWLIALAVLASLGCGIFSTVQVTAIAVGPGTPLPPINVPVVPPPGQPPPTPVLPVIQLEHGGARVMSQSQTFQWNTGAGGYGGSGASGPPGSGPQLTLPLGSSLSIVITYPSPPALLLVTEMDGSGIPVTATTFTPASLTTPYTPTQSGTYQLQVMAQWTAENFVLAQFALEVTP